MARKTSSNTKRKPKTSKRAKRSLLSKLKFW